MPQSPAARFAIDLYNLIQVFLFLNSSFSYYKKFDYLNTSGQGYLRNKISLLRTSSLQKKIVSSSLYSFYRILWYNETRAAQNILSISGIIYVNLFFIELTSKYVLLIQFINDSNFLLVSKRGSLCLAYAS